jgi:hypothetical protein
MNIFFFLKDKFTWNKMHFKTCFDFVFQAGKFSQDPECGKSKGCYSDCAKGCTYEAAWEDTGASVTFDLRFDLGTNPAWWAAIGISQDAKMVGLSSNQRVDTGIGLGWGSATGLILYQYHSDILASH